MPSPAEPFYLDHAATSPLLPEAREAMIEAMGLSVAGALGNASSLHSAGHRAHELIEAARAEVAALINADPSEIIFTSGGSEANNTVMRIFEGTDIVTSPFEHPSILEAAKSYAKSLRNFFPDECPLAERRPSGRFGNPQVRKKCSADFASVMLANNEIGTIFDVKELAKQAHAEKAFFHTDATQALGKIPIDVRDLDVDYLTASAHKIGGPIGIGILYVRRGVPYRPLIVGGHQENRRRAGTSPVINIAGFGAAARHARTHRTWELYDQKIRPLRDLLAKRITEEIPYASINDFSRFLASECPDGNPQASENIAKNQLPHIVNASFRAAEGESIQLYLDLEGNIQVSTGSACASGDGKPSHVLMALTGDAEIAHSSVRFSLGLGTTEQDIDHVIKTLKPIIKRLQGISTIKL